MSGAMPSFKEIRASLSPEKRRADGPWTKFILRPLSYPATWLFSRLGLSPNAVTYLSALLCVAGFVCLAAGGGVLAWVGFGLFFAFGVLDCVDGNMARVLKRAGPWGEWVDALGGYTGYATMLLAIGVAADASSGPIFPGTGLGLPWPAGGWTLVGGVAAAANLLMRVVFQNFRAVKRDQDRSGVGGEKRLSETIGITGLLVPLSAMGYGFGFLPWVVLAYCAVYGGGCLLTLLKLIRKVEREIAGTN
jgi:phosphatidylglycerophosphate synthase